MKNYWLGNASLVKTFWFLVISILIYFYVIHSSLLHKYIESLGFYIFVDMLGVVLSFFILGSVWRSANNYKGNKIWPLLSKISLIVIVIYSLYKACFKWRFPDLINNIF